MHLPVYTKFECIWTIGDNGSQNEFAANCNVEFAVRHIQTFNTIRSNYDQSVPHKGGQFLFRAWSYHVCGPDFFLFSNYQDTASQSQFTHKLEQATFTNWKNVFPTLFKPSTFCTFSYLNVSEPGREALQMSQRSVRNSLYHVIKNIKIINNPPTTNLNFPVSKSIS